MSLRMYEEREGPPQQSGSSYHAAARLCHQPEPQMAGRERLRMAEADRPAASGQVTWTGEGGLAVRLQLRRPQPDPAAQAHGATRTGKAQGAVRLKAGAASGTASRRYRKPHEYSLNPTSEQIPSTQVRKSPRNPPRHDEVQHAPKARLCDRRTRPERWQSQME